jgi:uncharacterized small protein (DUF1192 family)
MPLWRTVMKEIKTEHAEILGELIDRTLNYFNDPKYELYEKFKKPLSENQISIRNYEYLIKLIHSKISQMNTGLATPLMEIRKLAGFRHKLSQNDNLILNKTKEEINEKIKIIDNEIARLEQEMEDRKELEQFLLKAISEIEIENEILKISK